MRDTQKTVESHCDIFQGPLCTPQCYVAFAAYKRPVGYPSVVITAMKTSTLNPGMWVLLNHWVSTHCPWIACLCRSIFPVYWRERALSSVLPLCKIVLHNIQTLTSLGCSSDNRDDNLTCLSQLVTFFNFPCHNLSTFHSSSAKTPYYNVNQGE